MLMLLKSFGRSVRALAWTVARTVGVLVPLTATGVHAGPALLFDPATGAVLYAEDQDDAWHPASLTKMMTAYLTFEALKQNKLSLNSKIKVSELAHSQPPSKIGLPVGAELDVERALQALIIKSANDVAVMLAEGISGTHEAFVERMNTTAKRLGMTRTIFMNPNGLPAPEQVTTARDLGKLTRALLKEFPEHGELWHMEQMQVGRRHIRSHNQLLKAYDGADGMKTGFTCDSGYNVVATATRDGHKLAAIILGEPSGAARSLRAANLLEHGFQYRAWQGVLQPVTLDSLEQPPDTNSSPISVRAFVPGPACGGRRESSVDKVRAKKKRLAVAQQKADAVAKTVVPTTVKAGEAKQPN
jgi:D-alanyl-D-alanine carboxypeptidase